MSEGPTSNSSVEERYAAAWRSYRWRFRLVALVFLGGPVILQVLAGLRVGDAECTGVALGWLVAFVITGVRWRLWHCPRCQGHFFLLNPFARRCLSCGLPKWASGPHAS
jgi:hypothetical protein